MELAQIGPKTSTINVESSTVAIDPGVESRPTDLRRKQERILALDGLRGIAASAVLLNHFTSAYQNSYTFKGTVPFTLVRGVYGVPLFFLISGFVIFRTLERTKRSADFAKSRFVRLYPAFWLSVLISFVIRFAIPGPEGFMDRARLIRRTIASASMVPYWFHIASINHSYWTLSVEMTFYVIMFALLYWNKLDHTVPVLTVLVALGAADAIVARFWPNPISPWLRSLLALEYIELLLIGVLLYKLTTHGTKPVYLLIIALCLAAPLVRVQLALHRPGEDLVLKLMLVVLVFLATTGRTQFLEWRPLVFLGTISYALYLNHAVLGTWIIYHAQRHDYSPSASIMLATAGSIILATAITFWFEKPVAASLRRRLGSSST